MATTTTRKASRRRPPNAKAARMIAEVSALAEGLAAGRKLGDMPELCTVKMVRAGGMDLAPPTLDGNGVKRLRDALGVSQGVLAQWLGVAPRTLQAWEQGSTDVPGLACRALDQLRRNPEPLRAVIAGAAE